MPPRVAVLIPCLNEETSIWAVVRAFAEALPGAEVHVCDNGSTDRTRERAASAGAVVSVEPRRGKGFAVRRLFREVEADVYIMVDGDDTYDAAAAPALVRHLLAEQLDMVVARRQGAADAYPPGHRTGNAIFSRLVSVLFGRRVKDLLSGYRAFSRAFVKSFDGTGGGFEIETEITVHAITRRHPFAEVDVAYRKRAGGSVSKLNTLSDGLKISAVITRLALRHRIMLFR
jgi:glycosyltransferase involved in cell wall biosynthesis